jgi:hypothetical protein
MRYDKPMIVAAVPAVLAVRGSKQKGLYPLSDAPLSPPHFQLTPGVYEADE